jgi:hypothetical protein
MELEIGVAGVADAQRMAQWAADEGWNPGNTDIQAFFSTDPGGFLIGRVDGVPQLCISVVRYGRSFGFLGYYIARPAVRGKGLGIQMWRAGMARLEGRNVGLDGVVAQQHNYRKSGFTHAWNNVRHEGPPPEAPPPAGVTLVDARSLPLDKLSAYDRRFFPESREGFLAAWISLPERSALAAVKDGAIEGLVVVRASRSSARVGPLYAGSPEIAAALLSAAASRLGVQSIAVDIPDLNKAATTMAAALGLRPSFETARMYTAAAPAIDMAGLYGVTSLELG